LRTTDDEVLVIMKVIHWVFVLIVVAIVLVAIRMHGAGG
jgi:hypothetical protein